MKHSILTAEPIFVVITGGTIDAEAYPDPANPPQYATMRSSSAVPDALKELALAERCVIFEWLRKDSQEFTETDMAALARIIEEQGFRHVVIVHGTDRMVENAKRLSRYLPEGFRVAFTGAMIPLANGKDSDGWRNLRFAVENLVDFPAGVSIAFDGQRFDPLRTRKVKVQGKLPHFTETGATATKGY